MLDFIKTWAFAKVPEDKAHYFHSTKLFSYSGFIANHGQIIDHEARNGMRGNGTHRIVCREIESEFPNGCWYFYMPHIDSSELKKWVEENIESKMAYKNDFLLFEDEDEATYAYLRWYK